MIKEFRDFVNRGNFVDIAVAFVLGAAFAGFIGTFTERIVNPLIGLIFSLEGLDELGLFAGGAGSVGAFIGAIINFLIIAFVMFLVVKAYNRMRSPAAAAPPEDITLLREIRDAVRK